MRNLLYFVLGSSGNSLEGIQALTHRKTASLQYFEHLSRVRNSTEGEASVAGATTPSMPECLARSFKTAGGADGQMSIRVWPRKVLTRLAILPGVSPRQRSST